MRPSKLIRPEVLAERLVETGKQLALERAARGREVFQLQTILRAQADQIASLLSEKETTSATPDACLESREELLMEIEDLRFD